MLGDQLGVLFDDFRLEVSRWVLGFSAC